MLQPDKTVLIPHWNMRHEGHDIDMDPYLLSCKVETGLGSDTVPQQPWECTPVETTSWVVEAGSGSHGDMAALVREPCNSVAEQAHTL